jgi:hypothetical protein
VKENFVIIAYIIIKVNIKFSEKNMAKKEVDSVTKEFRKGKQHLVPSKGKPINGCPTREQRMHNENIDAKVKILQKAPKNALKAMQIESFLLEDIFDSVNPKNKGIAEEVRVENPDFDPNKPPCDETNPVLITQYRHKYDPQRYKENTILAITKNALRDNDEYYKAAQENEKEMRKKIAMAQKENGESEKEGDEVEDNVPLISLDWEDSPTVN